MVTPNNATIYAIQVSSRRAPRNSGRSEFSQETGQFLDPVSQALKIADELT